MHTSDSRFGSDSVFSTVSWLLEQFSVASSGHCSTASAGIWLLAQFRISVRKERISLKQSAYSWNNSAWSVGTVRPVPAKSADSANSSMSSVPANSSIQRFQAALGTVEHLQMRKRSNREFLQCAVAGAAEFLQQAVLRQYQRGEIIAGTVQRFQLRKRCRSSFRRLLAEQSSVSSRTKYWIPVDPR